jgi:hypothetical protein
MTTPALREQDALFAASHLARDAMDGMTDPAPPRDGSGLSETSMQLHRQAAQHRSTRLRTIEALRRPSK